jgi:hypothetical protein
MENWAWRSSCDVVVWFAICIVAACVTSRSARALSPSAAGTDLQFSEAGVEGIQGLIQYVLVKNMPAEYEDTSKWGKTKEVWAGVKVSRDGLRLRTNSRKKRVNHGTWEKYRAWPIDPESAFKIEVENARNVPGQGIGFDLIVVARLGADGRLSEWQRGLQLYSLSAEAEATVRLRMSCIVGMALDVSSFPMAVALEPVITDAQLELIDFRLKRISKLRGSVAHELGRALRDVLRREVARRSDRLVKRINEQINENRDELRFSLNGILPGVDELWKDFG